jgi:UDP-N-acetylmuramate-alanine ligase
MIGRPTPGSAQRVHLIGICGTGMGGLAGLLAASGRIVSGSDVDTYPPMSDALPALGIPVARGFAPRRIRRRAGADSPAAVWMSLSFRATTGRS